MIVRDCDDGDIKDLVRMTREFWRHTSYKDETFIEEDVIDILYKTIEEKLCLVLDIDGPKGFICGVKGPLMGNFGIMTGTELGFWVDVDHRNSGGGLLLLSKIEERAKQIGIKYWNMAYMVTSMPESVRKIYDKMGYELNECLYQKVL